MNRVRRLLFLSLLVLLLPCLSNAQVQESGGGLGAGKSLLKGILQDAATAPLAYASVTLFSLPDSAAVTGAISDETGGFEVQAKPGRYFLRVQLTAYRTHFSDAILLEKEGAVRNLEAIVMASDASLLDEVVIKAEKSQVQFDLDKKVYNVGKDLANKGGSAAEVLDNVPSVTVDVEGNVSLRGSENVRILIDGKPSGLVSFGSAGLRNLPANLIDRVEVVTNPSARYEAEGMAGIINIVLKKDKQKGINGSFDLTAGQPDEYGAAFNLNYRRNNLNLFGNYGVRYNNSPGSGGQYQEYYSGDTTRITAQTSQRQRKGLSNSARFGADYFLNPKNTLTTAFSWQLGDQNNSNIIEYRDYLNNTANPTGITRRTDDESEVEPNLEYSLTYKKRLSARVVSSAPISFTRTTRKPKNPILPKFISRRNSLRAASPTCCNAPTTKNARSTAFSRAITYTPSARTANSRRDCVPACATSATTSSWKGFKTAFGKR